MSTLNKTICYLRVQENRGSFEVLQQSFPSWLTFEADGRVETHCITEVASKVLSTYSSEKKAVDKAYKKASKLGLQLLCDQRIITVFEARRGVYQIALIDSHDRCKVGTGKHKSKYWVHSDAGEAIKTGRAVAKILKCLLVISYDVKSASISSSLFQYDMPA